jgi:hypothetical protein
MPYADPSAGRVYQAKRRRESIESKRYACKKCGYALRDLAYLRNHERSCTFVAVEDGIQEALPLAEEASPLVIPEGAEDTSGRVMNVQAGIDGVLVVAVHPAEGEGDVDTTDSEDAFNGHVLGTIGWLDHLCRIWVGQ